MTNAKKVRVAIIGVGNCASSLVQGVHYYREAKPDDLSAGMLARPSTQVRIIPIALPMFPSLEQRSIAV